MFIIILFFFLHFRFSYNQFDALSHTRVFACRAIVPRIFRPIVFVFCIFFYFFLIRLRIILYISACALRCVLLFRSTFGYNRLRIASLQRRFEKKSTGKFERDSRHRCYTHTHSYMDSLQVRLVTLDIDIFFFLILSLHLLHCTFAFKRMLYRRFQILPRLIHCSMCN